MERTTNTARDTAARPRGLSVGEVAPPSAAGTRGGVHVIDAIMAARKAEIRAATKARKARE